MAKQKKLEESVDLTECTFKPQTNPLSEQLSSKIHNSTVIDRLQFNMV